MHIPRIRFCRRTSVFERRAKNRHGHTQTGRRHIPRGGRRASDLVRVGVFASLCALVSSSAGAQGPMQFGFDAKSVHRARGLGMPVTYGSTWAGASNQKWGWNGVEDDYLAEQAAIFHQRGITVVVGFGNWGQSQWRNFDRAVAAADLLGTMALQSSVRDASTYSFRR